MRQPRIQKLVINLVSWRVGGGRSHNEFEPAPPQNGFQVSVAVGRREPEPEPSIPRVFNLPVPPPVTGRGGPRPL